MSSREIPTPKVNLNVPAGTLPLTMDMQKFFEFSFWMAEELLDLEAEFACWRTPASTRGKSSWQPQPTASTADPTAKSKKPSSK